MPLVRGGRPLKRWRYVGVFGERAMACVGFARVGGLPQAWWAVWDRDQGWMRERTVFARPGSVVAFGPGTARVRDGDCAIDLVLDEAPGVETVCRHGAQYVWTRKQAAVAVRGTARVAGETVRLDALGVVDDTAGYHAQRTEWRWSAGVGRLADGRAVGWNLVAGVNDPPAGSERSVWVDGVAHEVAPVVFGAGLGEVGFADGGGGALRFHAGPIRERHDELLLARSDYRQPFGTFTGALPGAGELAEGYGVMEWHRARW